MNVVKKNHGKYHLSRAVVFNRRNKMENSNLIELSDKLKDVDEYTLNIINELVDLTLSSDKHNKNKINMIMAEVLGLKSKCVSKKVGALVMIDDRILSNGYNGTPKGYKNCSCVYPNGKDHTHHEWSKQHEIHGEMNAINWAARKGISIEGADVYVPLKPCDQCTKNMIAAGIKNIYYSREYEHNHNSEELDIFLTENDVKIIKL
jgi:dCMP deaminase